MAPIRLAVNRLGLYMCGMVVEWSRRSAGYYKRSRVRLPAVPLSANNLGQVVRAHVPLSLSSVIRYRSSGGDALRLGR